MAIRSISVTQLKHAVLDERWRHRWLAGESPPTQHFSSNGGFAVKGQLFHQLAERFVSWLTDPDVADITAELTRAEPLWQVLYRQVAEQPLEDLAERGELASAHHLSQCLRVFCQRLEALHDRTADFQRWPDVFLGNEFPLQGVVLKGPAGALKVSGRIDAVRSHPDHGLEVVDYKLSHGAQLKHDLVQLAIYARLLENMKPGLRFSGVLEFYEPQLHLTRVSADELLDIFDGLVAPCVAELSGGDSVQTVSSDIFFDKIRDAFAAFRLGVEVVGKSDAPQVARYRLRPAAGVKVVSLANRANDLQVALDLPAPPVIEPAQGCVTIDIPKAAADVVPWESVAADAAFTEHPSPLAFPVGVGADGRLIVADLADANTCHALVAGASGSGKSEFLKMLVAAMIARNSPDVLRLTIIDPKILTFCAVTSSKHLSDGLITDLNDAIDCLARLAEEMDRRYLRLSREGFDSLGQRHAAGCTDIPYRIVLFDEFADLVLAGKTQKQSFERLVSRLAAKGRAAGIHLVLATQRPDRNIVTGPIKANLPLRICLKVTSAINSQIVLDQPGAEKLLGRGDLLCDCGVGIQRAQSPFIPNSALRALVSC